MIDPVARRVARLDNLLEGGQEDLDRTGADGVRGDLHARSRCPRDQRRRLVGGEVQPAPVPGVGEIRLGQRGGARRDRAVHRPAEAAADAWLSHEPQVGGEPGRVPVLDVQAQVDGQCPAAPGQEPQGGIVLLVLETLHAVHADDALAEGIVHGALDPPGQHPGRDAAGDERVDLPHAQLVTAARENSVRALSREAQHGKRGGGIRRGVAVHAQHDELSARQPPVQLEPCGQAPFFHGADHVVGAQDNPLPGLRRGVRPHLLSHGGECGLAQSRGIDVGNTEGRFPHDAGGQEVHMTIGQAGQDCPAGEVDDLPRAGSLGGSGLRGEKRGDPAGPDSHGGKPLSLPLHGVDSSIDEKQIPVPAAGGPAGSRGPGQHQMPMKEPTAMRM